MRRVQVAIGGKPISFHGNELDLSFEIALEEFSIEYDYDLVPMQATILDIGAGYGEFSLQVLENSNPKFVYLFEPNQNLIKYLDLNLSAFKEKIHILNCAVLDITGWTKLLFESHRTAAGSIAEVQYDPNSLRAKSREVSDVRVIDIKEIINKLDASDLVIKCDAEGSEYRILEQVLKEFRGNQKVVLFIEYHQGIKNLNDLLRDANFVSKIKQKDSKMGLITSVRERSV